MCVRQSPSRVTLRLVGAVTLEAARAPPAAISPAPTMMASSPIMSSAPREQKPVTVHSPGYATNYNYSSLPPQTCVMCADRERV
jgi:hypothetical protein